jgi:hypothetical protein
MIFKTGEPETIDMHQRFLLMMFKVVLENWRDKP